jgi:transcription elongation GreA/GreB family factor
LAGLKKVLAMFPFSKQDVWLAAKLLQETRLLETEDAIKKVRESGNNESKSSMGDKYETGKAMSQNEIFMLSQQQENLQQEYRKLLQIKPDKTSQLVEIGSLVQTEKTYCLIAAAIGTVILHGHKIAIISEISPLAKLLIGKTVDQQIKLGQQETKIVAFI